MDANNCRNVSNRRDRSIIGTPDTAGILQQHCRRNGRKSKITMQQHQKRRDAHTAGTPERAGTSAKAEMPAIAGAPATELRDSSNSGVPGKKLITTAKKTISTAMTQSKVS
jgi:hypothetical protein